MEEKKKKKQKPSNTKKQSKKPTLLFCIALRMAILCKEKTEPFSPFLF